MRSCVVLLSILLAPVLAEDVKDRESLLVQINSGLVRGYKDPQKDIFVFNGIPYATAPTVLAEDVKDRESLLVQINSGLVRGYKDPQKDIFVFNGIPYATAPTEDLLHKGMLHSQMMRANGVTILDTIVRLSIVGVQIEYFHSAFPDDL
ncbi:unnamed protein product [Danaus chrysippus]|uniref:(African queen) hypothetical protein n=1 Tax=Danaus chrysippus TaxID=151541 RepID=A0A8J2R2S9_9NEOP|nr:unnamed protein product [Danaus chrysippus]